MASGSVWGIDIGKSSLKAVRLREEKAELEIQALCRFEYEMAEDGTIAPSEAMEALEDLIRQHPEIKKESAFVALPGNTSFCRFIALPAFDPRRLDEIVGFDVMVKKDVWHPRFFFDENQIVQIDPPGDIA